MRLRSAIARRLPSGGVALRRLDRQKGAIDRHRERIGKHDRRIAKLEARTRLLSMDFARIELQLGALEAKVERLARDRDAPIAGDSSDVARARQVVDVVQQEHQQIRARFQIITRYEERLRRVEDILLAEE